MDNQNRSSSIDRRRRFWANCGLAVPRGQALFLGLFALLNVLGELRTPGFDANPWWIKLPVDWLYLDCGLLGWSACCFLWFATHPQTVRLERIVLGVTFGLLLASSLWNATSFYQLLAAHTIRSLCPIPFSFAVAGCLLTVLAGLWWPSSKSVNLSEPWTSRVYQGMLALTFVICGLLFPLAQMFCFGTTDYRRPADVIVVLGAKVYEDGQLSNILEERVRTGCELYRERLASRILFSGGPGAGKVHETEGMRRRALELGVPASAILLDPDGLDTDATSVNTLQLARKHGWKRILAVSQFYHLPRIKLAFRRHSSEVYTVPAVRIYQFRYMPFFMLREIAAWWVYYIRPLWPSAGR